MQKQDIPFTKLFKAYKDCRKNKRNKPAALEFEINLEKNLLQLHKELNNRTYEIGASICFVITDPKPREIWAGNFRDRIVHHLVYNEIKDRFIKRFTVDTFSCLPKRGTLAAAKKVFHYAKSITENYQHNAYYLKADLSNFFVSINKDILFKLLKKHIDEEWLLYLLEKIIYHNPKQNVRFNCGKKKFALVPKHKSLWHNDDLHGLPIGNLTSQFFSNVYLNEMDQFIKRKLHCKYYCRYVDDFVILHPSAEKLNFFHQEIGKHIEKNLDLRLHPAKKEVNFIKNGIDFVGYNIKVGRIVLRTNVKRRAFRRIVAWRGLPNKFSATILTDFRSSINSYMGMMRNINMFAERFNIGQMISNLFLRTNYNFEKFVLASC